MGMSEIAGVRFATVTSRPNLFGYKRRNRITLNLLQFKSFEEIDERFIEQRPSSGVIL